MEFHEAAGIFPLDEDHVAGLAADIADHGLLVPIELLDGKIIDGRRRWLACQQAGIEPGFVEVTDVTDPVAYVVSLNLHRRHLTMEQRGMVAARIREAYAREAKKKQNEAGARGGEGGRGHRKPLSSKDEEGLPPRKAGGRGLASTAAGKVMGVSAATVDRARQVLDHGHDDLIGAVDRSEVSITAASVVAEKLPKHKQAELVAEGPAAIRQAAKKLRPKKAKESKDLPARFKHLLLELQKLAKAVGESDKGLPEQRTRMIDDLKICARRIKESVYFLT